MLVYLAKENRVEVVDFGPVSPRSLDPADFPLSGGFAGDLFGWPAVKEDRNVHGALSFAGPGEVDGLGLALEPFGTQTLAGVLAAGVPLPAGGNRAQRDLTLHGSNPAQE